MSTTGKVVTGIVVALIVFGAGYYWYSQSNANAVATGTAASEPITAQTQSGSLMQSTSSAQPLPKTSDAALAQDSAAIDAQMNSLDSDTTSVNQSLSANP
jgi:uncharacterized protein HemX